MVITAHPSRSLADEDGVPQVEADPPTGRARRSKEEIRSVIRSLVLLLAALVLPVSLTAQDAIRSAMSAGPASISAEATVIDWSFDVLREGSNG